MNAIVNFVVSYAVSHQDLITGFVVGYALGHVPQVIAFLFHQAMRVPFLRAAILSDPARTKKLIDDIHDELDKDIDAEADVKSAAPPKL